jgi:hypothetical protein
MPGRCAIPDRGRRGIDAARAARLRRARAEGRAYRRPGPNGRARLALEEDWGKPPPAVAPRDGTYDLDVCADSFAEFLYGISIENALWWALERAHSLEPRLAAYPSQLPRPTAAHRCRPRYHDQRRSQRRNIVVPRAASTRRTALCQRPIAKADLSGRRRKSRREPEYIADQRGAAFPGVDRRAQGLAHPSAPSILGLTWTSSMRGQ